VSVRLRVYVW